jgi:hypothetical protein
MLLAFIRGLCSIHDLQSNFHQSSAVANGLIASACVTFCDPGAAVRGTQKGSCLAFMKPLHKLEIYDISPFFII